MITFFLFASFFKLRTVSSSSLMLLTIFFTVPMFL